MEQTTKISFTGDIMCEKPLQRAYETHGAAVFARVFAETGSLFGASDCVVGNLETVFGGPAGGYTKELYRFNSPDDFAAAVAEGGFHVLTTAANHCLDRGVDGLIRTLDTLDRYGLAHTGTSRRESDPRFLIRQVGGARVAFLNYTYGTNVRETGVVLRDDELFHVNLLKPQTDRLQTYEGGRACGARRAVSSVLALVAGEETRIRLKRVLGMRPNRVRTDHLDPAELDEAYFDRIRRDLTAAKAEADVLVACLHCGGQFNREPGALSEYFTGFFAENGADAVICHHSHVVQRFERTGGVPIAYCLGNFSISPSSVYLLEENKPAYGVALHLYLEGKRIVRTTASVLKISEDADRVPVVWPADRLFTALKGREKAALLRDVQEILLRLTGRECPGDGVLCEYEI